MIVSNKRKTQLRIEKRPRKAVIIVILCVYLYWYRENNTITHNTRKDIELGKYIVLNVLTSSHVPDKLFALNPYGHPLLQVPE